MSILLVLIISVLFIGGSVGLCFLQAYLSKRLNWWLGLILPLVNIALTALVVFGLISYVLVGTTTVAVTTDYYEASANRYDPIEVRDLTTGEYISWHADAEGRIIDDRTGADTGLFVDEVINNADAGDAVAESGVAPGLVAAFIIMNVPTAVYMIIYGACRDKLRAKAMIQKMEIQDL